MFIRMSEKPRRSLEDEKLERPIQRKSGRGHLSDLKVHIGSHQDSSGKSSSPRSKNGKSSPNMTPRTKRWVTNPEYCPQDQKVSESIEGSSQTPVGRMIRRDSFGEIEIVKSEVHNEKTRGSKHRHSSLAASSHNTEDEFEDDEDDEMFQNVIKEAMSTLDKEHLKSMEQKLDLLE